MTRKGIDYKNIAYGMMVDVRTQSGFHSHCKVHFFNEKGVLVGRIYEFVTYDRLFVKMPKRNKYPRYFYEEKFEKLKSFWFVILLRITSKMMRLTQNIWIS